jgi:hypothetical protein
MRKGNKKYFTIKIGIFYTFVITLYMFVDGNERMENLPLYAF